MLCHLIRSAYKQNGMEKENKTKPNESQYFDELLTRIRDIRSSNRSAAQKISDIIASAYDFDGVNTLRHFAGFFKQLNEQGEIGRLANRLLLHAESSAQDHQVLCGKDYEHLVKYFINDICDNYDNYTQYLYEYPSFNGVRVVNGLDIQVRLPEELQNFKGSCIVLKIANLDHLIDNYSSRNIHYPRAYAILADLDKQILECAEKGFFRDWIYLPYMSGCEVIFEFSHFEVDLREPDKKYRTLFVVYRYIMHING